MTDKIMIDGVDVSECEHYAEHLQEYIGTNKCDIYGKCNKEKNCYYKQLQRTQKQYNAVVEQNKNLQQQLKRKEEECEVLNDV